MVFTVKKGTGKTKLNEILKKFKRSKRFNAKRYLGKVKWDIDALEYQKKIRNDWG